MQVMGVLETCLYAADLDETALFYTDVLGLPVISRAPDRHVFLRCGRGVLLLFNPHRTGSELTHVGNAPVPLHGSFGAGHVAFSVPAAELPAWRRRLRQSGIEIESEVTWPHGETSIYVRDPAGNSVELASPRIWGLSEA